MQFHILFSQRESAELEGAISRIWFLDTLTINEVLLGVRVISSHLIFGSQVTPWLDRSTPAAESRGQPEVNIAAGIVLPISSPYGDSVSISSTNKGMSLQYERLYEVSRGGLGTSHHSRTQLRSWLVHHPITSCNIHQEIFRSTAPTRSCLPVVLILFVSPAVW